MAALTCFKAYDIRGRLGVDLDAGIARRIGSGLCACARRARVVVGRDCRASSEELMAAVVEGLVAAGRRGARPWPVRHRRDVFCHHPFRCGWRNRGHRLAQSDGLQRHEAGPARLCTARQRDGSCRDPAAGRGGCPAAHAGRAAPSGPPRARAPPMCERVLSFVDVAALRPMTILVNAGNGAAGPTFDAIAAELAARGAPLTFLRLHHEPDGRFPNGIPNPLLPENQPVTGKAVVEAGARRWAWPGMAISTAASCSIRRAASFPANTSWACWPPPSLPRNRARRSFTIRA